MNPVDTNSVLNRLLVIHYRSLPMYLSYAVPWTDPRHAATRETLATVVAAQKAMVDRIGQLILENGGEVDFGRFPFAFTALHDLSFDYVLREVIAHQEQTVVAIAECVELLRLSPLPQALAQEALGEAKGYLDCLRELAPGPR